MLFSSYFGQWMKQPWSEDMDIWQWVLFVLFITTVAFGWYQVLRYIVVDA